MDQNHFGSEFPRSTRYESLDLWRGLACLSVVVFHVAGHARTLDSVPLLDSVCQLLWLGVPIFFVISGYCIAATCDSGRRNGQSMGWYVRRRVRRILPPYWICLGLSALAASLHLVGPRIGDPSCLTPEQWFGNLTLTERWRPRLLDDGPQFLIGTAWSLCYEEQFYLVCGLAMFAVPRSFFLGTIAVSVLVLPLTLLNWSGAVNLQGFFCDGYWFQFAAGVLVYRVRNYSGNDVRRLTLAALLCAGVALVASRSSLAATVRESYWRMRLFNGTAVAFGFASVLLLLDRWDVRLARTRILAPLRACGVRCYSIYLTHLPVLSAIQLAIESMRPHRGASFGNTSIDLVETIASVLGCVVAGAIFYSLVERRFLNTPDGATCAPEARSEPPPYSRRDGFLASLGKRRWFRGRRKAPANW